MSEEDIWKWYPRRQQWSSFFKKVFQRSEISISYHFETQNKKLNCQLVMWSYSLLAEDKIQPETLQNFVRSKGWCQCEKR